jgi:hypothetical protein
MKFTEGLVDSLFYMAPALLVFFTAYFLIKKFLDNQQRMHLADIKETVRKDLLPLRLQAYERIVLYLERISPNNLLIRVYEPGMNVRDFHKEVIAAIRTEFEHNVTQQVYVTNSVWAVVRNGRDELIKILNQSFEQCSPDASGQELSRKVFETMIQKNEFPIQSAIDQVKTEAHQLF